MDAVSALNKNRRFNDPAVFCEGAFNRFHAIYD
jgi:D-xylose reductase